LISLSRDGGKLAYSVVTVRQNLWSIPIPKGEAASVREARPVTTGNQAIEGVDVSPDAKWVVFDSNRSGNQEIYKMPLSGGELVRLTTHPAMDCCPTWSPDGREVAFHSLRAGNRDIFVVSADGGDEPVPITSDPAHERFPHWSPDGREIVFQSGRSGGSQIYVLSRERSEVAGESPRQVTFDDGGRGFARWSPKGDAIAFGAFISRGVFLVPASGGSPRELALFGEAPLWSLDGETVFFQHTDGIWSVSASGGTPRLLVRFDDPSRLRLRSEWSTDGKSFYFALTEYESDVFVIELEVP
jgi:TolB protein